MPPLTRAAQAVTTMLLALLITAQTDTDNTLLANGYHGLAVVVVVLMAYSIGNLAMLAFKAWPKTSPSSSNTTTVPL